MAGCNDEVPAAGICNSVGSLLTLEGIESLHMSMAAISAFHIDVSDVIRKEDLQLVLPAAGLASDTEPGKPPWINFVGLCHSLLVSRGSVVD